MHKLILLLKSTIIVKPYEGIKYWRGTHCVWFGSSENIKGGRKFVCLFVFVDAFFLRKLDIPDGI